ncbi:larval serum protein 1 beta chain-like [Haematobia irritans]|uniref:larval serum protein 1 beta chain-like n=1 Tax=Haematobia irritans TaxID=7368 RepID=UPI003F504435
MKLTLIFLGYISLVVASTNVSSISEVKIANKEYLEKEKFLLEIVYRVEDPLMFEEWIKLGNEFVVNKSFYTYYDYHMDKFWESYKKGVLLPKGEFFGALVKSHQKQAWGLFNFFYYAKDWETFVHNVCWARMHVNEGMFVYALTLAVFHRDDFRGLILPSVYEILPQHFFNSKLVYSAEKFDYDVWSKYIMYEKEIHDVYSKDNEYDMPNKYFYMKDWKMWQWWKLMGLEENWYAEEKFMLRENIYEFHDEKMWQTMMQNVKMWWTPVDYTRDIDIYNKQSILSYFTEDVGWNTYWYYMNMDQAFFMDRKTFGLNERRGEVWIYNVQKLMPRYYMECLSHGFGEIPEFHWMKSIEYGYNPQLIAYNGLGYSQRQNYYEFQTFANLQTFNKIHNAFQRIEDIIEMGYYKTYDGQIINLRKPNAIEYIGNLMQANIDVFDKYFFNYYYLLSHMELSNVQHSDVEIKPNVLLNYETMMRDPLFYMFHKKIVNVFFQFKNHLKPYTTEELSFPGVAIKEVHVSELATHFDLVDFDVTNLLNDEMTFIDGNFVWDKTLLARQMRLNHKPFNISLAIESEKHQKAFVRIFIAPKYDQYGQTISIVDNRENFFTLDKFVVDLNVGKNIITHSSNDFYWTYKDRLTYTELYNYVMMAYEGQYDFPLDLSESHCLFPDRLLLPRGWKQGMPMTMFIMVSPFESSSEYTSDPIQTSYSCGFGYGGHYTDNHPLFYPFDREIDEYGFFVPNMYFKDVEIYHHDQFEYYIENEYKDFGKFDYSFSNDYYTKYY